MNKHGAASVNALRKALPFDGLLYLTAFGSQVRGTERPDSDLDVLFVVRTSKESCYTEVRRAVTGTPGGVEKVSIIPHIPETVAKSANVYGSLEYRVLRGCDAETLYRSADFSIDLKPDVDYAYSASIWMERAEAYIYPRDDCSKSLPPMYRCSRLYSGIDCLLRASLMSVGVKFPDTRDLRVLHGMLPPNRRPPLDLNALAAMREKRRLYHNKDSWSHADAQAMSAMASDAHGFIAAGMRRVRVCA